MRVDPHRLLAAWRLFAIGLLAVPATAQLGWESAVSAANPAARYGHTLTTDPVIGSPLLFGGRDQSQAFGDTWMWLSGGWQQLASASSPSPRCGHAMDRSLGHALLFGGVSVQGNANAETWLWDGAQWLQQFPAQAPSARHEHALAYDFATSTTVLLFGGRTASGYSNETWQFGSGDWSLVQTATQPPARAGHVLLPIWDGWLLIGGADASTTYNDSWLFTNGDWQQLPEAPIARTDAAAAWLGSVRMRHLFIGGEDAAGEVHHDAHERVPAGDWLAQPQTDPVSARKDTALLDLLQLVVVGGLTEFVQGAILFGGRDAAGQPLGDTWIMTPDHPATLATEGAGCGPGAWGDQGPDLFSRRLIVGNEEQLSVYTRTSNIPVAVGLGFGPSAIAAGCGIHIQPAHVLFGFTSGTIPGIAAVEFTIQAPFVPALAGLVLDTQAVALEPEAPGGVAISAVLRITIGS